MPTTRKTRKRTRCGSFESRGSPDSTTSANGAGPARAGRTKLDAATRKDRRRDSATQCRRRQKAYVGDLQTLTSMLSKLGQQLGTVGIDLVEQNAALAARVEALTRMHAQRLLEPVGSSPRGVQQPATQLRTTEPAENVEPVPKPTPTAAPVARHAVCSPMEPSPTGPTTASPPNGGASPMAMAEAACLPVELQVGTATIACDSGDHVERPTVCIPSGGECVGDPVFDWASITQPPLMEVGTESPETAVRDGLPSVVEGFVPEPSLPLAVAGAPVAACHGAGFTTHPNAGVQTASSNCGNGAGFGVSRGGGLWVSNPTTVQGAPAAPESPNVRPRKLHRATTGCMGVGATAGVDVAAWAATVPAPPPPPACVGVTEEQSFWDTLGRLEMSVST